MKIAFIGQKGVPSTSGGVEIHVENLAINLAKRGHEVYVYARTNYTDKSFKKYKGVNLITIPSIATKHLDAISHTFLACFDAVHKDYDIVHFHSIGPSLLIPLFKLLRPRVTVFATFHSQCYHHQKWGKFARACLRAGEFMLCEFADNIITVSKILKAYVKTHYNIEANCVPNAVNAPKYFSPEIIKENWGLDANSYFLIVSRLIHHKGIHHAIEAYKKLNTDKKLVIVGDGFYSESYTRYIRELAQNEENIIFTGRQYGKALAELYSNASFFIQPSESEGLSIALLEAMSYGKPIIASNIPENIEPVANAGYFFKVKNHHDLSDKIQFLLDNPELGGLKGKIGSTRVEKLYSWSAATKQIERIYYQELSNSGQKNRPFPRLALAKRVIKLFAFKIKTLLVYLGRATRKRISAIAIKRLSKA